jgi:hypothetical protein
MDFLRRHWVAIAVLIMGLVSFAAFTWSEYGYFCDQGRDHGNEGCESFWSMAHLHDWIYNASSNWQSELLVGVLLVIVIKNATREDA